MTRAFALLTASVLQACTCSKPAPPIIDAGPVAVVSKWPDFPQTAEARAALTKRFTQREVVITPEITPESAFAEAARAGWSTLPSGPVDIREWIDARNARWFLLGTFHDSSGQIDTFRWLIGPNGVHVTHVALEQFRADGRWTGTDAGQVGDTEGLMRAVASSERAAWKDLGRSQAAHAYTAWKYGYVAGVVDIVATAKAMNLQALGCDVPDSLLQLLPNGTDDDALRIRELHCLFAIRDAVSDPTSRVAMLWGQAHVRTEGFRRYLHPRDSVLAVYAFGARHSDTAPDEQLRDRLVLNDLVLVPLAGDEAALFIPDQWIGGNVARVRSNEPGPMKGLRVSASTPGAFTVGDQRVDVNGGEVSLALGAGAYTYCFESNGVRVVGHVDIAEGGGAQLAFDVPNRATQLSVEE